MRIFRKITIFFSIITITILLGISAYAANNIVKCDINGVVTNSNPITKVDIKPTYDTSGNFYVKGTDVGLYVKGNATPLKQLGPFNANDITVALGNPSNYTVGQIYTVKYQVHYGTIGLGPDELTNGWQDTNLYFTVAAANVLPTVTTTSAAATGSATATLGGSVTNLGLPNPTQHGFVWGLTANPTTVSYSGITSLGAMSSTGSFTSNVINLTSNTTYHIRVYATNIVGTAYGADLTFTTPAAIPSLTNPSFTPVPIDGIQTETLSGNGNNISLASYRIFYTTDGNPTLDPYDQTDQTAVPGPTATWTDSTRSANITPAGGSILVDIPGSYFDKDVWTYVVIKLWMQSPDGTHRIKFLGPYEVNLPRLNSISLNSLPIDGYSTETLLGSGAGIADAAYRIFYTTKDPSPGVSAYDQNDPNTIPGPTSDWTDSTKTGNMSVSADYKTASSDINGSDFDTSNWKYVVFKIWMRSPNGTVKVKFSNVYQVIDLSSVHYR